jgi:hypothetical protein
VSLVCLLRPSVVADELASVVEGTTVKVFVLKGLSVRSKGIVVNLLKRPLIRGDKM